LQQVHGMDQDDHNVLIEEAPDDIDLVLWAWSAL
jgi:hypothetical protein